MTVGVHKVQHMPECQETSVTVKSMQPAVKAMGILNAGKRMGDAHGQTNAAHHVTTAVVPITAIVATNVD